MPKSIRNEDEIQQRRERKALKRQKQREENVGRAKAMHVERIKQSLLAPLIKRKSNNKLPSIMVGCSGWFYWHWKGQFYPQATPTNKWFDHYSKHFKTVELNAPFYSWPTLSSVKNWIRQSKKNNFVYTVKVSELITHVKKFSHTKTLVRDFSYIADLLGPKMGCFLFQLPPSFSYSAARLKRILNQLDPARRNVLEFRHKSWWRQEVFSALKKAGVIFCSTSAPNLPDTLVRTTDELYIRFHGLAKWYNYLYSPKELREWVVKIKESGAKRVWVYFNNDRDGSAPKNAKALIRLLKKEPSLHS